jgi:outer membrane protein TolC
VPENAPAVPEDGGSGAVDGAGEPEKSRDDGEMPASGRFSGTVGAAPSAAPSRAVAGRFSARSGLGVARISGTGWTAALGARGTGLALGLGGRCGRAQGGSLVNVVIVALLLGALPRAEVPTSSATAGPTPSAPRAPALIVAEGPRAATAGNPGADATPSPLPELTLSAALDELDRASLSLVQARARAGEAAGVARQAAAALLPTLTATGVWLRNSGEARISLRDLLPLPPGATAPQPVVIQAGESLTATGALRVPIAAPNAWYDLGSARDAARAAERSADASRLQLRAAFAQAAHAARALEEVVLAADRARETSADHARSAERRVAAGTAAPLDHLRARTDLVARESEAVLARSELARARLGLGVLLGRRRPVRVLVEPPTEPSAADADVPALVADALAHRPELAARRAQLDAAEDGVRSARARLLPQLSATVSAFASDVPNPAAEKEGWRATVDLAWALYDGGFRYGKRRQALAALDGARAAADESELAVAQEVEDAARDLGVARERLRLAETQRALAADAAGTARRSFEAGLATALDVTDANDRLFLADVGLADARARLAQGRIALDRALGRAP